MVKADNKNANFPTQFCLESISDRFSNFEPTEVCLMDMCMIFQSITVLFINFT